MHIHSTQCVVRRRGAVVLSTCVVTACSLLGSHDGDHNNDNDDADVFRFSLCTVWCTVYGCLNSALLLSSSAGSDRRFVFSWSFPETPQIVPAG